mmetsp:Transcript_21078/g.55043  ORF Transcript_21078/g.55043 Transcript_21078/m.55043 type:complete len:360 (-) Transcript_21078:124-1203(-)
MRRTAADRPGQAAAALLLLLRLLACTVPTVATLDRCHTPGRSHSEAPPLVYYNRVPKAGSTTVKTLIYRLRKQNGYLQKAAPPDMYFDHPGRGANEDAVVALFDAARRAGKPAIYDVHSHFIDFIMSPEKRERLAGEVSDVHYINVLRNPVERYRSHWYFQTDPVSFRPEKAAVNLQRARLKDAKTGCGCADISFNECIEQAHVKGCDKLWEQGNPEHNPLNLSRRAGSQVQFFLSDQDCEAYFAVSCKPGFAAPFVIKAMAHMEEYTVIGLTERMKETVELLEARLPAIFEGASQLYANMTPARVTRVHPNIAAAGPLVSERTEAILRGNPCNAGEFMLWEHAKRLFHDATGLDVSHL